MKFLIEARDGIRTRTDLLVIGMSDSKWENASLAGSLNQKLNGEVKKLLTKEGFEGKFGQSKLIVTHGKISAPHVLIIGTGDKKSFNLEIQRKLGGRIIHLAQAIKASTVSVELLGSSLRSYKPESLAQALVEGFALGTYNFVRYKKPSKAFSVSTVSILCQQQSQVALVRKGVTRGELLSAGVSLARDLINTPAKDMTPLDLAKAAKPLKGIRTRIYNEAQIRRFKMGAFLGVSQGSDNPPALIEMHYKPSGKAKKIIALVGKGVTFDSGGYSLKPPKGMETMKDDMSGAAAVIGLMSVISQLKPQVEVWGIVAATENMIGARAQRPGDIVKAMNGKTIEVLNTDAEGRLTLADAIGFVSKKKPDYIIDTATLTGACLVALGDRYSAILGNDPALVKELIESGKKAGENLWELPLVEEYKEELKSPIADLKNIGGGYGGTINGALFIQEFVGNHKWAHIDIAGPSWTEKPYDYESRGGTGVMVRTFAEYLASF
jgi:leucyl aminopeptidase